jgi:hypothetical protein
MLATDSIDPSVKIFFIFDRKYRSSVRKKKFFDRIKPSAQDFFFHLKTIDLIDVFYRQSIIGIDLIDVFFAIGAQLCWQGSCLIDILTK